MPDVVVMKDGYTRSFPAGSSSIAKMVSRGWQIIGDAPTIKTGKVKVEIVPDNQFVSVIMPAWNAGKYIGKAIASMQAQALTEWELLIVDDGSTDDTAARARQAAGDDKRIKITEQPHGGYAIATNTALAMSIGGIIARLDADDEHHTDRLKEQWLYLQQYGHRDIDLVTCDMIDIRLDGNTIRVCHSGPMDGKRYMAGGSGPCHASVTARRKVYDLVGGFRPDEEWDGDGGWNMRVIQAGLRWGHIDESWYYHRRYPDMRSEKHRAEQDGAHAKLLAKYNAA
ncbi:MAG: glycosyltransferase family 2 protein [Phycisphaerae bacterium]|nr:glycosyltransferase family 2 protein [Phycisphaerae bacterium]